MSRLRLVLAPLVVLTVSACVRDDYSNNRSGGARAANGTNYAYNRIDLDTMRIPNGIVDSAFQMADAIRRFRKDLPEPNGLENGASSRQALVEMFVAALATRDTKRLGELAMSRAEFAYLYYPLSRDAMAPSGGMPPTLRWDLLTLTSEKGIARALERLGGQPLTLVSLDCPNPPGSMGMLVQHDGCTVQLARGDGTLFKGQLFGSILEQGGHFKFIGYVNDM
jgi:hypothetical protein